MIMRKILMLLCGILTVGALAACTPTKIESEDRPGVAFTPETEATTPYDRTPDPNLPSQDMVFIFRGNDKGDKLERVQTFVDKMDEFVLMDKLIEYGVVDEDTDLLSFEIQGGEAVGPGAAESAEGGERIGILDLSQVPLSTIPDEKLMLSAIGNTYMENFELDKVKLLVEGANYESDNIIQGDDDYLEYVSDYTNVAEEEEEVVLDDKLSDEEE